MIFQRLEYKPVRRPHYIDPHENMQADDEDHNDNEDLAGDKGPVQTKQAKYESAPSHEFNVANTWAGMNGNAPERENGTIFLPKNMPVSCI